ncbi:uncharacterized protein OCT59_013233 [Rhizophagus irregularis]|uniref:uncharacterized protein n=1 Tax=Rhizophagus irregularis TaxID=588596 RepID=UPI001C1BE971|nr:hypothetical protein OCT59_013233 [Rhizophagus irregularis]CAB4477401.1 unnamed protein product [Rhizophagus irregularis]CAB5179361.1 unnamed protein product [Rhizophagus irregularis]
MKAKIPPSLIASYISLASLIFSDHLNNLISLSSRILDKSPGEWGVNDWDMYYIKKVPETNRRESYNSLGAELKILLALLPEKELQY